MFPKIALRIFGHSRLFRQGESAKAAVFGDIKFRAENSDSEIKVSCKGFEEGVGSCLENSARQ